MSEQPSIINTILNESVWANNGILGDIKNSTYPKDYTNILNILDYNNSPQTDTLMNCNTQDQLKGILDETLLSNTFFSVGNIKNIQDMIRYYFHKEKNDIISEQNNNELLTIMRGIYLKYSNSAAVSQSEIISEVRELNNIVVEYSLKQIYINYDNYNRYIKEIQTLPVPLPLPKIPEKNNYTYDISKRNDMS